MRCRAKPSEGCFTETVDFLNDFKSFLHIKSFKNTSRIRSNDGDQLKENFNRLMQLDFKI